MLLIPLDRSWDWRNPPVITLLLLVLNVVCYFLWQSGDGRALAVADAYYSESGLVAIEREAYANYLAQNGRSQEADAVEALEGIDVFFTLLADQRFATRLLANEIIRPGSAGYADWRAKRSRFERKLEKMVTWRYGWKSASPTLGSFVAHMFLHADIGHLLGNMFFLLAVGLLVESVLSGTVFLACYLLVGFGSVGIEYVLSAQTLLPGIGASGAISGLMGMYSLLYWDRSVRVFAFLFVYFDYVKVPAILLLPLWVGNELYQMWSSPESNINFLAHLGGLISGALIGLGIKRSGLFDASDLQRQDEQEQFKQEYEQARALCNEQDYKRAKPILRKLKARQPEHTGVLFCAFEAEAIEPSGEHFHDAGLRLLNQPMSSKADATLAEEVFTRYMKLARPGPKLPRKTACRLLAAFRQYGLADSAARLASLLKRNKAACPELELDVLPNRHPAAGEKAEQ